MSGRLDDDTWHEVLRLLVGLLPLPAAERVIAAIVPAEAELPRETPRLGLAWQALAEIEPRHIPTLRSVCSDLTDLLYSWVRAPGMGADVANYQANLEVCRNVAATIVEAAEVTGSVAWPVLHPPAREWPVFATREFGPAWFVFLAPTTDAVAALGRTVWDCAAATLAWLRARAVDDPDANARGAALDALAQHFRDEPRTGELLRARAVDDPDEYARGAALAALAQHFRDEPRTGELLRARAVDDPDAHARGAALAALAQHFRDEPRTGELLRARAVDDPDENARRAALAALAQHFRDEPRTGELLRARAVDDPDAVCPRRCRARCTGSKHFRDEPRTGELLRTRAVDDPAEHARGAALDALAQHFRAEPRTGELLRARAVDHPGAFARGAALAALAEHFRAEPRRASCSAPAPLTIRTRMPAAARSPHWRSISPTSRARASCSAPALLTIRTTTPAAPRSLHWCSISATSRARASCSRPRC